MTILQIIFLITAIVITIAAVMTVSSPNLVHAALWLILALAGVAAIFVLLEASFLAVVQVAVYIDAIAILIVVTVMLTRRAMRDTDRQVNTNWLWAALAAFVLFGGLLFLLNQIPDLPIEPPQIAGSSESTLEQLGKALVDVDGFVIPFEVASVLLLAALIGAIFVARPPNPASEEGGEG
jgi:NADH-quinone oxidoreductase subunit J